MPTPRHESCGLASGENWFATTRWSVVLAAGQGAGLGAAEALETLCRSYWYPLYAYVRRQGHGVQDAEDLTQEFLARFLARQYLQRADPCRGRFRAFLIQSLKHFLVNEWARARAAKRGGAQTPHSLDAPAMEERYQAEPADEQSPDRLYEKRWAITMLERVVERLRGEFATAGKAALFEQLKDVLWGEKHALSYAQLGAEAGLSEGALKVAVHRLRRRYRELLREEVSQTVASEAEIDNELRHLGEVLKE